MKRSIHLFVASSLLVLQVSAALPAPLAAAHDGEDHGKGSSNTNTTAQSAEEKTEEGFNGYEFVTEPGGSLSLLTRRALQLYDQQKEDVSLTPAAAMYAETNIVQAMGSRLLEIGERVRIERPLLDKFVEQSQELSPETLAAWDTYASQASFALDDIKPTDTTSSSDDPPADGNNETEGEEPAADAEEAAEEARKNRPPLSAFWWLAGIAALGAIYYLLGRRNNNA